MTRYLISFQDGAMTFPEEDLPAVSEDVHAVVREAQDTGAWVFGGGLHHHDTLTVVATDGTITDGPYPEGKEQLGGLSIVDVPSRAEALRWAAKLAASCRCAQELHEIMPDPDV
jgi:hypothetical protein